MAWLHPFFMHHEGVVFRLCWILDTIKFNIHHQIICTSLCRTYHKHYTIPRHNRLSDDLFGNTFSEVWRPTASIVLIVHGIQHWLGMQNFVGYVHVQHCARLKLKNGGHVSWPHLQPAHSSFNTYLCKKCLEWLTGSSGTTFKWNMSSTVHWHSI